MICLKHNQQYGPDEYCIYCGDPHVYPITSTGSVGFCFHNWKYTLKHTTSGTVTDKECTKCGLLVIY